jgi:hypothetical protein
LPDVDRDNLLDDLSAYLDGELSPARAAEAERLLAESPEARALLAELREVRAQVRGLPKSRAPAALGAALRGQVVKKALWPKRVLTFGVPLAAAAVAALAVGLYLHQPASPQRAAVPQSERMRLAPSVPPVGYKASPTVVAAVPQRDLQARVPESSTKLEGQGWGDVPRAGLNQPALAIALQAEADGLKDAVEHEPLQLAIHPRSEAEHAQYAALLASWSPVEAPVTNGPSVQYVYQLAPSDVSARVAQLLRVQAAAEEPSVEEPTAAAPVAAKAAGGKEQTAERRAAPVGGRSGWTPGAGGNAAGEGYPRRPLTGGGPSDQAERVRWAHAQHEAVTAEPEVIVINAPGPASGPTFRLEPHNVAANQKLLDLLARGGDGVPAGATSQAASAPVPTTQAGALRVEMRVELAPVATTRPSSP